MMLPGGAGISEFADKVMQIKNNYDKEVFNGDIGRVAKIDQEAQELTISFDGREVDYDFADLDEVVLAYAVSVHKAQGSQYPVVVIPVHTQHYALLQRNLIYTGITRGRKLVVMVGTRKALTIAVKNNKTQKRYTRLTERLMGSRESPNNGAAVNIYRGSEVIRVSGCRDGTVKDGSECRHSSPPWAHCSMNAHIVE